MSDRDRPSKAARGWTALLLGWGLLCLLGLTLQATDEGPARWQDVTTGTVMALGSFAVVGAIWWPRRPPVLDPNARVVVRAEWPLRLGGLFAAVIGAGLWAGSLGPASPTSDPASRQVDGLPGVVLTVVVLAIGTVCLVAAWGVWWFRQVISPDEASTRVLFGSSRIAHSRATAITLGHHTLHAGRAGGRIRVGRIHVEGPDHRGRPARAGFDRTMTAFPEVHAVLAGWVHRRPELVADDDRARELLEQVPGPADGAAGPPEVARPAQEPVRDRAGRRRRRG